MRLWQHALLLALAGVGASAAAFDFNGEKSLVLITRDGAHHRIGSVRFEAAQAPADVGRWRFAVRIDPATMRDHFLSMREFKCLPAEAEVTCHVPYPHANPGTVRPDDLRWLEHHLLFFYKQPRDFGARLWNGLLFELKPDGDALVGTPWAVDLNRIAAPPERNDEPPFGPPERDAIAPDARWVRALRIE